MINRECNKVCRRYFMNIFYSHKHFHITNALRNAMKLVINTDQCYMVQWGTMSKLTVNCYQQVMQESECLENYVWRIRGARIFPRKSAMGYCTVAFISSEMYHFIVEMIFNPNFREFAFYIFSYLCCKLALFYHEEINVR